MVRRVRRAGGGGVREATGRSSDWSGHKTTWVMDPVWVLTVDLHPRSLRGRVPGPGGAGWRGISRVGGTGVGKVL